MGAERFFNTEKCHYPILCFHRVHPIFDKYTQPLHPNQFKEILKRLSIHFTIVPLTYLVKGIDLPENACAITFDDALLDFYSFAYPVILEENTPVTMFVPTESVLEQSQLYNYEIADILLYCEKHDLSVPFPESKGERKFTLSNYLHLVSYYAKLPDRVKIIREIRSGLAIPAPPFAPPMNHDQLIEIQSNGVVIEGHTHSHPWLPALSYAAVHDEIIRNIQFLNQIPNTNVKMQAYPMGSFSTEVIDVMNELELIGLSTEGRKFDIGTDIKTKIPRFNVSDKSFEELYFRINGFHASIQTLLN